MIEKSKENRTKTPLMNPIRRRSDDVRADDVNSGSVLQEKPVSAESNDPKCNAIHTVGICCRFWLLCDGRKCLPC